ncbi:MAG: TIGR01620 family protein [Proteobacteria bacterium]|nr:TIGR01620 family protein [Pseudomonadota bacterium]
MTDEKPRRKPAVIPLDDPDLVIGSDPIAADEPAPRRARSSRGAEASPAAGAPPEPRLATTLGRHKGIRWGAILISALSLLGGLALSLSFARFVSIAFERDDWLGWIAFGLVGLAGLSLAAILLREVVGIWRLARLGAHRRALDAALSQGNARAERHAVESILAPVADRPELKWPLARLKEHAETVNDPGDFARLADRDVMPALDGDARRLVAAAARRVATVTALSPLALITVGWVAAENLRLLRGLAALYGGRPGFIGTARLARMVFVHIVATGGVALTDDLIGQFLGQDLVRRLSRRLGEGVFNASMTARVGAAAIEVIRPLPFIEAPRIRARDFIAEIVRWQKSGSGKS